MSNARLSLGLRKMTAGTFGGQSRAAASVHRRGHVRASVSIPAATNEPLPEPVPCPTLLWQAPVAEADELPAFQSANLWFTESIVWNGRLYGVDWGAGTGGTSALVSISIVDPADLRVEHPTMVAYGLQAASPDEMWVYAEGPAPDYPAVIVPLSDPLSPLISWEFGETFDGLQLGTVRCLSYHPADGQLYMFATARETLFGPYVAFRIHRINPATGVMTTVWSEPYDPAHSSPHFARGWWPTRDGAFWRLNLDTPQGTLTRYEIDGWTASNPSNPAISRTYTGAWPDGGSSDRLAFEGVVDGVFGWFSIDPSGDVRTVKTCAAERGVIDLEEHFWIDGYVWHSPTQDKIVARVQESLDGGASWLYSLYDLAVPSSPVTV